MKASRVDWSAFRGFLERKQYGSESMVTRMFWRRGSWAKQFGIDGHMGYGGFHITQFFHFGKSIATDTEKTVFENWGAARGTIYLLIYLVPTILMIFGWYYLYRRHKNISFLLVFLVLLCTIGLVFYMNFADGHHAEKRDYQMWQRSGAQGAMPTVHREVRVRDYFYTPGFMFMGMWIGIAAGCLLHALYTSKNTMLRANAAPIASILFALSPILPIWQNWAGNDRSNDWVPYDYAYNLLMSCKRDGVLITNGDNDTFPLWALQEAYGIRRDVRIVNLSLLNTKWYIRQLKELEPKVPITLTDARIESLNHEANPLAESVPYTLPAAGITVNLPGRREMNALRIQDKMVMHIVDVNKWRKPVYFAVTVSNNNMMGLQPYLQMQGLVYEILPAQIPADERVDMDRTMFLLDKVYHFRGLGTSREPMNETTEKLLSNYAASFIQVALLLRNPLLTLKNEIESMEMTLSDSTVPDGSAAARRTMLAQKRTEYDGMLNTGLTKLDQCVSLMPWDWRPRALRQELLITHGRYETALEKIREALKIEPDNEEYLKIEAQVLEKLGRRAEANTVLRKLAQTESDSWNTSAYLCNNYQEMGEWDSAIAVMEQYQNAHPGDRRAATMLHRLLGLKNGSARQLSAESTGKSTPAPILPGPG
jgi:tetratricopeptide (TPR) repeat protein